MSDRLRVCLVVDDPGGPEQVSLRRAFDDQFELETCRVTSELPRSYSDLGLSVRPSAVVFFVHHQSLHGSPGLDWEDFHGPRLWFEQDAYQNFLSIANSRYRGRFPKTFRRWKFDVLVSTGRQTRDLLREAGVTAVWIPKAYNDRKICDLGLPDRHGLAHFGSRYPARLRALDLLDRSGICVENFSCDYEELNRHLNRFLACLVCTMDLYGSGFVPVRAWRFVPSMLKVLRPGIEPMSKNFEVAGAGCAPVCDYVPELEELGFIEGHSMVSYRDGPELIEKVKHYLDNPNDLRRIGQTAATLVKSRHTWRHRALEFDRLIRRYPDID